MEYAEIKTLYDNGNTNMTATLADGSVMNLRLFVGVNTGDLCYMKKGSRRYGYPVSRIVGNIVSVKTVNSKKKLSVVENEMVMLRKFKKAFTTMLHKNLWSEIREGYEKLSVEAIEKIIAETSPAPESGYDVYKILSAFSAEHKLHLITENNYKTTTIKSNKPAGGRDWQYTSCVENISRHLENKENFSYNWRSRYDVSVSGKLCDDGIYRAWLSLEYKNCGNGYYYLLINDNTAVFSEKD